MEVISLLSSEDIQMLSVPRSAKLDALFDVLHKLDDIDELLRDAIFDYMPFSENDDWQSAADDFFWNSEGMREINDVACALNDARQLTVHAIHTLEESTEAEVAY